jgi:hypothetical protein
MKKSTLGLVATFVVVLAIAVMVISPVPSKAASAPAVEAAPAASPAPVPPHPEIQRAIEALHVARTHIHDAAHDFGGHREDALHAVDEAIHQLEICMKY